MERRKHCRFRASEQRHVSKNFFINDINNYQFIDFSQQGFSFSSSTLLSVGDTLKAQIFTDTKQSNVFLRAIVCNRRPNLDGGISYGVFINNETNSKESISAYKSVIISRCA